MDQFEQQDRRWVAGFDARHTILGQLFGRRVETTFALQLRNDWVHNGLFRTEDRVRTDKYDINACNDEPTVNGVPVAECATSTNQNPVGAILPAATDLNKFTDTMGSAFVESKIQWASKFRSVIALRGDDARYVVTSLTPTYVSNIPSLSSTPVNFARAQFRLGHQVPAQPQSKLDFWPVGQYRVLCPGRIQFPQQRRAWLQRKGSNRFRRTILSPRPAPQFLPWSKPKAGKSACAPRPSHICKAPLRSGISTAIPNCCRMATPEARSASEQSSNRYGVEWANYYTPLEHLAFDFDIADSRAQFTQIDPDDAAFINPTAANGLSYPQQLPGGKLVPEAVKVVISSGVTLHDYKGFSASLRLRYFGPRDLTSDGINRSAVNIIGQRRARLSIQQEMGHFGRSS